MTLVLLLCPFVLVSCFSTGLPPGFRKVNGHVRPVHAADVNDRVLFSILSWYKDEYGSSVSPEVRASYEEQLAATNENLFRSWSKELLATCSPLIRLNNASIELVPGYFMQTTEVENGLATLKKLRELMENPQTFDIPLENCLNSDIWRGSSSKFKEQFTLWANTKKRLTLPDIEGFNREEYIARLDELKRVVESRCKVLAFLEEYSKEKMAAPSDWKDALEKASTLKASLPEGLTFDIIGDTTTLAEFNQKAEELPTEYLSASLKTISALLEQEKARLLKIERSSDAGTLNLLEKCEADISSILRDVSQDERFVKVLPKAQERFEELVATCMEFRSQIWRDLLDAQAKQSYYWEASQLFKSFWNELESKSTKEQELYFLVSTRGDVHSQFASILRDTLVKDYYRILPLAFNDYLQAAETAANIQGKYGVSFAFTTMMREMSTMPKGVALSNELAETLAKAMELRKKMEETIREKILRRTIFLADMTSSTPGIGLTYSKDLEDELKAMLASFGMAQLVVFPEQSGTAAKWDYVTYDGRVANFDGQDMTERQTTRMLRMFGESRRVANPSYIKDAGRDAPQSQTATMKYIQEESMRIIHVKEMERQAHLRLFMTIRGPGFNNRIEINEFYKKIFYIEESHPFTDSKVVNVHEYYDAMKVAPVTPEPELRYDRVWTPGEILDWARRDSLKVVALKLFYFIDGYPLFLEEKARKLNSSSDLSDALDCLSHLYVLCQAIDVDSDISKCIPANEAPVASSYVSCLEQLRKQRRRISTIKQHSLAKMLDATDMLLRQRLSQAEP